MGTKLEARPGTGGVKHSEETIEIALTQLALCAGSPTEASRRLAAVHGISVAVETINRWGKVVHADRYAVIRHQRVDEIHALVAHHFEDLALHATQAAELAVEKTYEQLMRDGHKDPASAARNLATVAGIATDKFMPLRGKATTIVAHKNVADITRAMQHKFPDLVTIEGTAEEVAA